MFTSQGDSERLPDCINKELDSLNERYVQIVKYFERGGNIDQKIIGFTIDSLKLFLEYNKTSKKDVKDLLSEAVGNIPLTFDLDNLKLSKNVKEIIGPLIDIIDAHACKWINREKFVQEVLRKLKALRD